MVGGADTSMGSPAIGTPNNWESTLDAKLELLMFGAKAGPILT